MNDIQKILGLAVLALIIDLPWLYIQGPFVQDLIRDIQADRSMNVRLWGAIPVYLAIGYLISQINSAPRAFLAGMCTYAVYDFTNYALLKDYDIRFAAADTVWGGVLFSMVHSIMKYIPV